MRIVLKVGLAVLMIVVLVVFASGEYDFVYRAF